MLTLNVQVPVRTHDGSIDMLIDGTSTLPSFHTRLAQDKTLFLPLMDSPEALEADTQYQLRGVCDIRYTDVPIMYHVILQLPRAVAKIAPRSRIAVIVHPDNRPDERGPKGLCDEDPEYAGFVSQTLGSLLRHNEMMMPVSRSAPHHLSSDFMSKTAIDFKRPEIMREVLDSRAWLRFTDTLEIIRITPRREYQVMNPVSIARLATIQYQHLQRLMAEERALIKHFGEIRDDGKRYESKRGIYTHPETELVAIREHSKRSGN